MARRSGGSPRKQPRQERAKATVRAIIEATAQVLVQEGFDKASTNKIAKRAGVSIGTLYQYFPNKEAVLVALMEDHFAKMLALMRENMAEWAAAPIPDATRALVATMLDAQRIDPALYQVLIREIPRTLAPERLVSLDQEGQTLVRFYLQMRADELRIDDLDLAAFLVTQTVLALTHQAVIKRPHLFGDDAYIDAVTEVVLRYLLP